MNIFDIHGQVIDRYQQYVRSFLAIADDDISQFIEYEIFDERALWPDALIQLNPAYQRTVTVENLVQASVLQHGCTEIFRDEANQSLRLYQHQEEAIRRGVQGASCVSHRARSLWSR